MPLNPFPDWKEHWKDDRDLASSIRNYLTHQGWFYTVRAGVAGETLVPSRVAFAAGVTWKDAEASFASHPDHWQRLETVCEELFGETAAFIDLSYERMIAEMDHQLTNPAYHRLWGWDAAAAPPQSVAKTAQAFEAGMVLLHGCSASKEVAAPQKTIVSSGPCISL